MTEHHMIEQHLFGDAELQNVVQKSIRKDSLVRESRVPVTVAVDGGIVTLRGNVLSETMRERVLFATAVTPGVRKVVDQLHSDPEIAKNLARALADDPVLKSGDIKPLSYQGIVTLSGTVPGEEQRQRATAISTQVLGVRQVLDHLKVK